MSPIVCDKCGDPVGGIYCVLSSVARDVSWNTWAKKVSS